VILLDTSGLLAALDRASLLHAAARHALEAAHPPRLLSPLVLAELDYLLTRRIGQDAALEVLDDVARGAYSLAAFGAGDVAAARTVMGRYRDLLIGLADASLAVLAARHGTGDILTLDERHFRVLTWGPGRPFRILPADA
jgi:predicted nucleic acid-binding protein